MHFFFPFLCGSCGKATKPLDLLQQPLGLLLPARGLQGGQAQARGPPGVVTEGNQAQTKALSWERLAHGASCPADVPGRMQLRRAIARASSPAAGSPPAPYLPAAFPDGLTCRKTQRQGSCCKPNAEGRAPGASAPLPLLAPGWIQALRFGPGQRDHAQSPRPFPAQQLPVPGGICSEEWGLGIPESGGALCHCSSACGARLALPHPAGTQRGTRG